MRHIAVHPTCLTRQGRIQQPEIVAGPLALLSLVQLAGYSVAGQTTAIREAASWLLRWQTASIDTSWPPHVTGTDLDTGVAAAAPGRRHAWCYGTPGISRSLTLAGQALNDPALTEAAQTALTTLATRPSHQWDVNGPTLCHGYAGVLAATAVTHATKAVLDLFDPAHRFGFRHVDGQRTKDQPGFLVGAAGVALTLADHGQLPANDAPTRCDALLLLS